MFDLTMSQRDDAKEDGLAGELRLPNAFVYLVLDMAGALDEVDYDEPGPTIPASANGQQHELAWKRWAATQAQRVALTPDADVKFPAVKLGSHSDWHILPKEARALARALRRLTPQTVQRVLEADEVEMEAISSPDVDDPADMQAAVSNVLARTVDFAHFCEESSEYGGFRAA